MAFVAGHEIVCASLLGALEKAVIRLIASLADPLRGTDHRRGSLDVAQKRVDSGGMQSELRPLEDLGIFFKDGWRQKKPHLFGHGEGHQGGRNTAGLEHGRDHDVRIIDNLQRHPLERGFALRTAVVSASTSSSVSLSAPLVWACF